METAFLDYACWSPRILPGGYLAIHDIFTDPAEGGQAPWYLYRMALDSGLFRELPRVKTLGILQRIPLHSLVDYAFAMRDKLSSK